MAQLFPLAQRGEGRDDVDALVGGRVVADGPEHAHRADARGVQLRHVLVLQEAIDHRYLPGGFEVIYFQLEVGGAGGGRVGSGPVAAT